MTIKSIKWNGEQVSKPGIYSNMPMEAYHAYNICDGPSISSSGLRKIFNESPAHFYCQWRGNPKAIEPEDASHFRVGRAVHHLMLGEQFFSKLFAIQPTEWPDDDGVLKPWHNNRNVCRQWNAARTKEGRAVLTKADVISIRNMVISLEHNPLVQAGALNGLIERSFFWKSTETGIWLKSRPDSIPGDSGDFVDLKTCQSVMWNDLLRTVTDRGYVQQGALVRQAARTLLKIANPTFTLVFVEKKIPYCNRIVTLKDSDLERGEKQNKVALEIFAKCLKDDHWPGPGGDREDAEYFELSERAQKDIDEKIEIMRVR